MSDEKDSVKPEVRRLIRLLNGISKTARDASLTGQLEGGRGVSIRHFNSILARLQELDVACNGLFAPVSDDASFDEVGVAATYLADFLRDEDDEDSRKRIRNGGVFEVTPGHVKIVGIPGNMNDLGDLLREYVPDFIKHRMGGSHREERKPSAADPGAVEARETSGGDATVTMDPPPAPPGAPRPPDSPPSDEFDVELPGNPRIMRLRQLELRLGELRAQMQGLSEQMSRPGLAAEQTRRLADSMGRLAQQQAEVAREQAVLLSTD